MRRQHPVRFRDAIHGGNGAYAPTVYTVLAQSARSRSRRYLTTEALLAGVAILLVLVWQSYWWPVASLSLAIVLYASWGLLARAYNGGASTQWPRLLGVLVAGVATVATLAGLGGLAVRAFSGTTPGPYGACQQSDGRTYACHLDGTRRPVSRPRNPR